MESFTNNSRLTIEHMMLKLANMRKEQDKIIDEVKKLKNKYEQLDEDIDLLEMMAMYQSNKNDREKEKNKMFNFK